MSQFRRCFGIPVSVVDLVSASARRWTCSRTREQLGSNPGPEVGSRRSSLVLREARFWAAEATGQFYELLDGFCLRSSMLSLLSLHESPEETAPLPFRTPRAVRNLNHNRTADVFKLSGCFQVHGLLQVIRGRMVPIR